MTRILIPALSGSTPAPSSTIIVASQNPPPILWTPIVLPRSDDSESISLRTINSREIPLIGKATQPIFAPAETPLRTLPTEGKNTGTSPDTRAVKLICVTHLKRPRIETVFLIEAFIDRNPVGSDAFVVPAVGHQDSLLGTNFPYFR